MEELQARFTCPSLPPRPPPPCPSRTVPVRSKDSPTHLPDAQLIPLSKCVACGLHWTSRKSANQKRTHIEQCAKKNALTKDTITFLIHKETASHTATTLMDSVVPTGPVKRLRRQQVVPTVRSLPETRESILHRAKDILGPASVQGDPLLTQQFGQSALACRKSQHPKRPALADTSGFSNEPPLTQPFSTSSLRTGSMTTERSRQLGTSMFDQDSILSNDRKRPASPLMASDSTPVRRRLQ